MDNDIWRIESRLGERIQEVAREMYSRTAKLDSDLVRLRNETDRKIWDSGMRICYVYLVMFAALSLFFLVVLHLYGEAMYSGHAERASSQAAHISPEPKSVIPTK